MKFQARQQKNALGFTLVEMLVYMVLLVLVVSSVIALLFWVVRANNQTQARKEVVESVEHALLVMTNEIRESQSVYTPTTTAAQLSVETFKNPPSGETSAYVDFFLCGVRICEKRESQAPLAITSERIEVQGLEFILVQTGEVPSVRVEVNARYANPANRPELEAVFEVGKTISLRAY